MINIIEQPIKLVKSDSLDDWYLIERAVHENKEWYDEGESHGYKFSSYQHSGRISDACVEGSLEEMKAIAEAIRNRTKFSAKRCAVYIENNRAFFYSPRNSQKHASVPLEFADKLAEEIEGTQP